MCVVAIVDANSLRVLATRQGQGDSLFLSWIKKRHGILAFTNSGKYFTEIRKNRAVMELIQRYNQGGQLRKISAEALTDAGNRLNKKLCLSNDHHILSLALASRARVLCSGDDALRKDFRNKKILPHMGRLRRILYPIDRNRNRRREFLNRQRCADRQ